MRHPAFGDNHGMPDLAHDTRQKSTFQTVLPGEDRPWRRRLG